MKYDRYYNKYSSYQKDSTYGDVLCVQLQFEPKNPQKTAPSIS